MKNFILIVSLAVVIGLWFSRSYVVVKEYLFIYIFISSLTYIIISYIKSIQKYKDAGVNVSHDKKYSYIIIYGVLIAIVISKIATMLPQEYKGKEFNNFDNYFKNEFASKTSETYGSNKDRFSLSTSGYSGNDKRLGGPILLNYQEVFKVKSDKPYYLKGNVVDFYDGNKWTKTNENFYEITSGVNMKYVYRDGFTIGMTEMINSLTIYPDKKFKTNTVFVPNYAVNVSGVEGILLYDKSPIVLSKKVIQEEYNVGFYKDNGLMDTIEHVGDTIKRISERNDLSGNQNGSLMGYFLKPIQKDINTVIIKKSSLEDRFSYRNSDDFKVVQNYGKYLQVPENISKRTYNLVYDITKDCNTSIEKVLEIKKYLTENYSYDLQVSVIPEGSEFIDYFLFVEKKGYCTYFNTAMTVMCRISGVPARYVEGFKTPSKKDDSGLYNVSSSDAHAWGEVLLGEVGNSSSNIWTIADASPTASEDIQIKEKELKEKQISDADSEEDITSIRNRQNKIGGMDSGKGENKSIVISDNQFRILFVLTTIILFILMKIIKVWKRRNNLFKYKLVTPLYNYYLDRLAVILIVKPEFQGDLEFAEGIVDSQLKEKMLVLVRGSYGEFYGKHSATRLNNKEYYDFLEEYLKDYEGKIKYLLNKYLG
ncbi:transglutaminase-like domain-containing protein [Clostridium sp.]|uniref:transglutaminase-like domain-containing protein n=1 Tax=Clostridium sp. TaxID=1506 RepID=UPI003D6CFEE6